LSFNGGHLAMSNSAIPMRGVREDGGRRLLLVVDHPGRREEATVADLHLEDAGFDVQYLLEGRVPQQAHDAESYARSLLMDADPDASPGRTPHAVLAYCMAAPIAQEVARLTGASMLLLFDGEPVTSDTLATEYLVMVRSLCGRSMPLPVWWNRELLHRRNEDLVLCARTDMTRYAVEMLSDDDPDEPAEDVAEELVGVLVNWIAYLAAAFRSDFPAWHGEVLHITSRNHDARSPWPGADHTSLVRLEVDRLTLLSHDATRETVLRLLGDPRAARTSRAEAFR
jgi:hypothetical protein